MLFNGSLVPYIPGYIQIFGVTIHAFGFFVTVAILLAYRQFNLHLYKLKVSDIRRHIAVVTLVSAAFTGSCIVFSLIYCSEIHDGHSIIGRLQTCFTGMSSLGGFVGVIVGLFFVSRLTNLSYSLLVDKVMQASLVPMALGRLGCTFANDHPGRLTEFILGTTYPGGSRHNLGLYEFLFLVLILLPVSYFLAGRVRATGLLAASLGLTYCVFRFFIDFLRSEDLPESDVRFMLLTPAQYGCLAFFVVCVFHVSRTLLIKDDTS